MNDTEKLDVQAEAGVLAEQLADLPVLAQNIREDFFEKYESNRNKTQNFERIVAYEANRYSSLFRILDMRLWDIYEKAAALEKFLDGRKKEKTA